MSVMTAPQVWPITDRPLTVADLDDTPDDGCRYELDDGVLVVSPAPRTIHQWVLHRLAVALEAACPARFQIIPGPGVEISDIQYRVPDLIVVRARQIAITDPNITRPPELAVEIASPSTAAYDRNRKKTVYAEFGIPAYWIVDPDPDKPSVTAFALRAGTYVEAGQASGSERFTARSPFPVEIVPADLVAGPWRR